MISFVLPARGRPESLKQTILSMRDTTYDFDDYELFVICDDDDTPNLNIIPAIRACTRSMNIHFLVRDRDPNLSDSYYNWVFFNRSPVTPSGSVFGVLGDDVRFLTDDWDKIALKEIKYYLAHQNDYIAEFYPKDASTNKPDLGFDWGWFPMMTRQAAEAQGFFMPKEFPSWGADTITARTFNAIGRHYPLSIFLDHISYHAYDMKKDETAHSMSQRFNSPEEKAVRACYNVDNTIRRLRDKIGVA